MMYGESPQDAQASRNYRGNDYPSPQRREVSNNNAPISSGRSPSISSGRKVAGTMLEAAFVDPAYSWPPADGQGKNAIELQASTALMRHADPNDPNFADNIDDEEVSLSPSMMSSDDEGGESSSMFSRPKFRAKKVAGVEHVTRTKGKFCCKRNVVEEVYAETEVRVDEDGNQVTDHEAAARQRDFTVARANNKAEKARRREVRHKRILDKKKRRRRERRAAERMRRVPEGILVYRLDTTEQTITLVSGPSSNTDIDTLVRKIHVVHARPAPDRTRRGILITGVNGERVTLVACEQRTAIAWLESIDMMLATTGGGWNPIGSGSPGGPKSAWAMGAESKLSRTEREEIEERYVNLAAYSNNLIRAGALPGSGGGASAKGGKQSTNKSLGASVAGGAGGIYYTVTQVREDGEGYDDETLESIAKRRAVIKDSWDFFRMVCSLLRDRRKYDEVFRKMQLDPVYPYLNSMTGLNDPGDDIAMGGNVGADKPLSQTHRPEYDEMSQSAIARDLVQRAEVALPSLVEICKALAGSLGMEEVGVGPVKEVGSAIRKAEKKYEGDVLKVTDYCRSLLVVKDFPTLLALLELARDSFGPLIRRVKLSTLKTDRTSKPGGYRDCIINLELKDHICEISIHLWPMWVVCGVDGFRHYRKINSSLLLLLHEHCFLLITMS